MASTLSATTSDNLKTSSMPPAASCCSVKRCSSPPLQSRLQPNRDTQPLPETALLNLPHVPWFGQFSSPASSRHKAPTPSSWPGWCSSACAGQGLEIDGVTFKRPAPPCRLSAESKVLRLGGLLVSLGRVVRRFDTPASHDVRLSGYLRRNQRPPPPPTPR